MNEWNKLDIGKIIVYKIKPELGGALMNEEVAIYGIDSRVPNIVKAINYPLALSSRISSVIGLVKSQEKEKEEYLKEPGDWYCKGYVSKQVMEELERIAKTVKTPFHEDLSSPSTFH